MCGARSRSLSWIISRADARSMCLGMTTAPSGRRRKMENEVGSGKAEVGSAERKSATGSFSELPTSALQPPTSFDCRSCGACCSMRWSWPLLRRDRSDAVGIPAWMQRRDYPLLCTNGDRCAALCGQVGNRTWCGIYEVRPDACRKFVPGSPLCLEARGKFDLP